MVCAAKGYPLVVTMAESFSVERRKLMRFLGAKVVLTPKAQKGFGMYTKPRNWPRKTDGSLPASLKLLPMPIFTKHDGAGNSCRFRRATTGLLGDGLWDRRHRFGCFTCIAERASETKIILTEPANAAIVSSGYVNTRNVDHQPTESHPRFRTPSDSRLDTGFHPVGPAGSHRQFLL